MVKIPSVLQTHEDETKLGPSHTPDPSTVQVTKGSCKHNCKKKKEKRSVCKNE